MNNKIKQLAEEAGFMMWDDESWNPGDVVDWSARYDTELETFAKLIVKECAQLVDDHDPTGIIEGIVLQHFGVE